MVYPAGMADESITVEVDGVTLTLTNLSKPLYPDGTTKGEVIDYYRQIAPVMLPHLAERALTRQRFPNGVEKSGFYEKNAPAGTPDWVRTHEVRSTKGSVQYLVAEQPATLMWLANLASLDLHAPQWRIDEQPDPSEPIDLEVPGQPLASTMVIDLDPGEGVTTDITAQAAMIIATELLELGMNPFAKTSGSKGIQIYVPIIPVDARQVEAWVKALSKWLVAAHPDRFVATIGKQDRAGLVYVDFMQNKAARNTASVYTLRSRQRPTVSTPVSWEEIAQASQDGELAFDFHQVLQRVAEHGDLFSEVLNPQLRVALPAPLEA